MIIAISLILISTQGWGGKTVSHQDIIPRYGYVMYMPVDADFKKALHHLVYVPKKYVDTKVGRGLKLVGSEYKVGADTILVFQAFKVNSGVSSGVVRDLLNTGFLAEFDLKKCVYHYSYELQYSSVVSYVISDKKPVFRRVEAWDAE